MVKGGAFRRGEDSADANQPVVTACGHGASQRHVYASKQRLHRADRSQYTPGKRGRRADSLQYPAPRHLRCCALHDEQSGLFVKVFTGEGLASFLRAKRRWSIEHEYDALTAW